MKTDRTTNVLLALIAMALFVNAIVPFTQPAVVQDQSGTSEIRSVGLAKTGASRLRSGSPIASTMKSASGVENWMRHTHSR